MTKAISSGLAERKLDALLVSGAPNVRYLTGFTGDNGNVLVTPEKTILFTDPRFQIQAEQEVACEVRIARGPLVLDVLSRIKRLALKRIGYEPARMTCDTFESLKSRLPMRASLEPVNGWVEELRMVKSPDEIERIGRSVGTNSEAFEQ